MRVLGKKTRERGGSKRPPPPSACLGLSHERHFKSTFDITNRSLVMDSGRLILKNVFLRFKLMFVRGWMNLFYFSPFLNFLHLLRVPGLHCVQGVGGSTPPSQQSGLGRFTGILESGVFLTLQEFSLFHKLWFSNPFIFATQYCRHFKLWILLDQIV